MMRYLRKGFITTSALIRFAPQTEVLPAGSTSGARWKPSTTPVMRGVPLLWDVPNGSSGATLRSGGNPLSSSQVECRQTGLTPRQALRKHDAGNCFPRRDRDQRASLASDSHELGNDDAVCQLRFLLGNPAAGLRTSCGVFSLV